MVFLHEKNGKVQTNKLCYNLFHHPKANTKHAKNPRIIKEKKQVEERMLNDNQDHRNFDDNCVAGIMEQGKVYTEENTLKTKVHALFTKKFTESK